ncbi:MAG: M48 family metallopeptidase [Leptospiraceae bacterium]|nr:M48 family metallopeptidase [Leptospiraceae bacterium]
MSDQASIPVALKKRLQASPLIHADYRHAAERWVLYSTLITLTTVLIVGGFFSAGTMAGAILIVLLVSFIKNRYTMQRYVKQGRLVTAETHPELWRIFQETRQLVPVPANTELYVQDSHKLNAYAIGAMRPYKIIINSVLLDYFNENELKSIIGHELGHIRFGHTSWALVTGVFEGQAHGFLILGVLIRFVFLFYSRLCENSADRAGLVACGNLRDAVSAELKLNLAGHNPSPALIEKFSHIQSSPDDSLMEDMGELASTHPTMKGRIRSLLRFAQSPAWQAHAKAVSSARI